MKQYALFILSVTLLCTAETSYARTLFPTRIVVRRHYEPVSLTALVGATLTVCGVAAVIGYLCSESEEQKNARLERERQHLAAIAAMTPEQREIYYQEERLKLERQKANALQSQANAAWWNYLFAPSPVYYEPAYIEEITIY